MSIGRIQLQRAQPPGLLESGRDFEVIDAIRRIRGDLDVVGELHGFVRRSELPVVERRNEHRLLVFVHEQHAARRAAVGPRQNQADLTAGEADVVREVTVAARRAPRRHPLLEDLFLDRNRPRARFLVRRQRHAEVAVGVALKTLALENFRDLAIEDDLGRDRDVPRGPVSGRSSWEPATTTPTVERCPRAAFQFTA